MNHQINTTEFIGVGIAYHRKMIGYTQEYFAELLNVDVRSVRAWEGGEFMPRLERLIQICNILGIEIGSLVCVADKAAFYFTFEVKLPVNRLSLIL